MAKKTSNYYFDTLAKNVSYAKDAAVLLRSCLKDYDIENYLPGDNASDDYVSEIWIPVKEKE